MTDMTLGRRSHVPALWTSFLQFFGYGSRLSLQPDTRFLLHGFRNLTIIFYWVLDRFLNASVHFRMLNSGWITLIWALFYLSHFHLGNSDDYFEEDSLGSRTSLVLHAWDSVPNRSYDGSFFV